MHHSAERLRKSVSDYGNNPDGTGRQQFEGNGIVAAYHLESLGRTADDVLYLRHIARGFLDGHDIRAGFGNTQRRLRSHIHTGASGYVVKHDGKFRGTGHRTIMTEKPFLRRFVIIRGHDENTGNATQISRMQKIHYGCRAVAAGTEQQRYPPVHRLHREVDNGLLLGSRQARRLGRSAQHAKKVHAPGYLRVYQAPQSRKINMAAVSERCDQRYAKSSKKITSFHNHRTF